LEEREKYGSFPRLRRYRHGSLYLRGIGEIMSVSLRIFSLLGLSAVSLTACAGGIAPRTSGALFGADQRPTMSQTFQYIGRSGQTFQVPSGVTDVTITAEGAGTPSARGGFVKATIGVRSGDTLLIVVGGAPHGFRGGYGGGGDGGVCGIHGQCPLRAQGGAGASSVALGTQKRDRILVAGGAGGNGGAGQYAGGFGGQGGGVTGGLGDDGVSVGSSPSLIGGGGGGGGGTRRAGGERGSAGRSGGQNIVPGHPGIAGRLAFGGRGGTSSGTELAGGSGGGGGGGYYGGGGGGSGANGSSNDRFGKNVGSGGGGGGGSSFVVARAKNIDIESGKGSDKNGVIVISW
jgi:hypothetical protein